MLKCSRMMTSILGNPVYLRRNYDDDDDDDDGDDFVGGDVHDDFKKNVFQCHFWYCPPSIH